jgi:hypothetical protein
MTTTATMEVPHGAAQSLPDSGGVRGLREHNSHEGRHSSSANGVGAVFVLRK